MMLGDLEIRQALFAWLLREQEELACGTAFLMNEFQIGLGEAGMTRCDLAQVGSDLLGFEIKSPLDSLNRLDHQAAIYGQVMDRMFLVTTSGHLKKARPLIPGWWGILEVLGEGKFITFRQRRVARRNTQVCPLARLRILWKSELHEVLDEWECPRGLYRETRWKLQTLMPKVFPDEDFSAVVLNKLRQRARVRWKRLDGQLASLIPVDQS